MIIMRKNQKNRYESSPERPSNGRAQPRVGGYINSSDFEQNSVHWYISINPDGSVTAKERALDFVAEMQSMRN